MYPVRIRTTRLDLLPLRTEHATEMAAVLSDPALHTFIGGAPLSPAALRTRYERLAHAAPRTRRSAGSTGSSASAPMPTSRALSRPP